MPSDDYADVAAAAIATVFGIDPYQEYVRQKAVPTRWPLFPFAFMAGVPNFYLNTISLWRLQRGDSILTQKWTSTLVQMQFCWIFKLSVMCH